MVSKLNYNGGAEKWVKEVSEYLIQKGHEVKIFVPQDPDIPPYDGLPRENEIKLTPYFLFKRLGILNFYPPFYLPKVREDFDVIYTTSMNPFLFFLLYRGKIISGVHDAFISDSKISIDSFRIIILLIYKLRVFNNVSFHTFSPFFTSKFSKTRKTIYEIPNFSDITNTASAVNDSFRILFIGRVEKRKGSDTLFRVANMLKNHPEIEIDIAGLIPDKFVFQVKKFDQYKNIRFLGYVSEERKRELLKSASLFLFLSTRDTFPFTILEALSYGVPVLTTWQTSADVFNSKWVEAVSRDETALLCSIREKYNRWKYSASEYTDMKEKIRRDTMEKYKKDRIMEQLEKMFKNYENRNTSNLLQEGDRL